MILSGYDKREFLFISMGIKYFMHIKIFLQLKLYNNGY